MAIQGIENHKFTEKELVAIRKFIHDQGIERRAAQGDKFNQADYCAGAMAWFFALGIQDKIPSIWVWGQDRDIFTELMPIKVGGE